MDYRSTATLLVLLIVPWTVKSQIVGTNEIQDDTVSLIFAGDISFDKPIRKDNGSSCPYGPILKNIKRYFQEADYALVNLEAPFVSREIAKGTYLPGKGIHNMAWPESVEALVEGGVDAVTLANNHLLDFGDEAVVLTHNILSHNSIDVMGISEGAYPDSFTRQVPIIKTMKNIRIGILAYCKLAECTDYRNGSSLGQALFINDTVKQDVEELKSKVDIVIVFLHWGTEYMAIPNEDDRRSAQFLVDLGVHLIVGSHPHVLQGQEYMNGTLIKYSLGNFVFHSHFTYMGQLAGLPDAKEIHEYYMKLSKKARGPAKRSELLKVHLNRTGVVSAEILPVRIKVDDDTGCLYPTPKTEDAWITVCGKDDENCYVPREHEAYLTDDTVFV